MNRRQRQKIVPSTWLIIHRQVAQQSLYSIYMIDWKRKACFSWEEWTERSALLAFRIPMRHKIGGQHATAQPCAKIAKKALWLHVDEQQYDELERLFYRPVSRKRWAAWLQQ
ncbi:hypothetical protein [Paenibacillus wenxiniae]|uniref:Uncharacterized protein n=1 Tax=Paenibacillus wenxiniae TaxID=1636843 RepID=A0ABW4REM7_9BACL